MKLFVIGGSGLIGGHILAEAKVRGHQAIGTFRKTALEGLVPLDTSDQSAIARTLAEIKPECVIHAAGWTWVDGCEDDPVRALAENATEPGHIAALCHARRIKFVYFSTSYVFDGTAGPYTESDKPNPINVYSKCKLAGEEAVAKACPDSLIVRTICVFGAEKQRKNFAYQVWHAMKEGKRMRLPSDQCGNPSYAGDIARWLLDLLTTGHHRGIVNLAGALPHCTRIEWANLLVAGFNACGEQATPGFGIEAVPTAELRQKALRPLRAGLICPLAPNPTSVADVVKVIVRETL
jgi:dTDP-4-dehydrorhamnose reductase